MFSDITYQIIGSSYAVFNTMGPDYSENDYGKALLYELIKKDLHVDAERVIAFKYGNMYLGKRRLDLVVEEKIIIELKVTEKQTGAHKTQLLAYLKSTGLQLGLLIYFTSTGVVVKRVINSPVPNLRNLHKSA